MDVSLRIKQRLDELGVGQKDLAVAVSVTESYISQLLAGKKAPSPARTSIYDKISEFLSLPGGELAKLADLQRHQELKRKVTALPRALFQDCRELVLRKCAANSRPAVERIFEKEPFGELERLVTQRILAVAQGVAKENLGREDWLRAAAQTSGREFDQIREAVLEFLESDVFHITLEGCVSFLDPSIEEWDIDLRTFSLDVVLSQAVGTGSKRFEFAEQPVQPPFAIERGLEQFLADKSMSGDATDDEIRFMTMLKFNGRRPTALYYYRELQSLRDPLHFGDTPQSVPQR
jgi:transcriptional regulator with XRE-family HTH domain